MMKFTYHLVLLTALVGCGNAGPPRASVEGVVLVDGQPLADGVLSLYPDGVNGPSSGARVTDGRYQISQSGGPVPGQYRAELTAMRKANGSPVSSSAAPQASTDESVTPPKGEELVQYIPSEYNTKTTLRLDVKPGKNEFNIDVHIKK